MMGAGGRHGAAPVAEGPRVELGGDESPIRVAAGARPTAGCPPTWVVSSQAPRRPHPCFGGSAAACRAALHRDVIVDPAGCDRGYHPEPTDLFGQRFHVQRAHGVPSVSGWGGTAAWCPCCASQRGRGGRPVRRTLRPAQPLRWLVRAGDHPSCRPVARPILAAYPIPPRATSPVSARRRSTRGSLAADATADAGALLPHPFPLATRTFDRCRSAVCSLLASPAPPPAHRRYLACRSTEPGRSSPPPRGAATSAATWTAPRPARHPGRRPACWLRRVDSNHRPSGNEPDELPLLHGAQCSRQSSNQCGQRERLPSWTAR